MHDLEKRPAPPHLAVPSLAPKTGFSPEVRCFWGYPWTKHVFWALATWMSQVLQGNSHQFPTWFLWVHTRSKALGIFWCFGVYVLCCVAPDAESQCILRSLELRRMNSLFLLCGVWRYPSLSPVWQLLCVSTDLCWLWTLSVVSCVHCTHVEAISVIRHGKHSLCFHIPESICK